MREKLTLLKELSELESHAAAGWISYHLVRREIAPTENALSDAREIAMSSFSDVDDLQLRAQVKSQEREIDETRQTLHDALTDLNRTQDQNLSLVEQVSTAHPDLTRPDPT